MRMKRVSDLWRGMTSRKSHVSELKNWMPMHSKKKKKKKMHRHPVYPTGVLLLVFFDLFKVSKINMTCSKSVK